VDVLVGTGLLPGATGKSDFDHETRSWIRDSCSKVEPARTDRRNVNDR